MADGAVKNKEQPLAGVVLCFTSILPEQRSELAEIAGQMGAVHKYDLTSDVTHLLVGETNTEKYKFVARERSDVMVLKPEWIEAVRQSWMDGGDTDLKTLEQKYKLPTFHGLVICVTGFDDMDFRNYLQETANANGADFRKDLTKTVTHLVAREPTGQKYKFATQWKIKVVSLKWFDDSLERGMTLDESRYDPLLPSEEQGAGAWDRSVSKVSVKREKPTDASNPRARKLRRVASSKLGDLNEGIWGDIVGGDFDLTESTNPIRLKTKNAQHAKIRPVIQEAKSFASETTINDRQDSIPLLNENPHREPKGFLQDCYFFIHGFSSKQTDVLRDHLTFNGAQIVESLIEFSSHLVPKKGHGLYIIVPYKVQRSDIPSTDDMGFECEVVTDMWLERCLDSKTLVPPESHVTSTPFPRFPIPGFHGMRICSTGFAGIDLLHLSKLVNIMGAEYDEYLTPRVSVLICNDPQAASAEKLRHTFEWRVPAVSADWLWISVQTGQKKPFDPYLVQNILGHKNDVKENIHSRPNGRETNQKDLGVIRDDGMRTERLAASRTESTSCSAQADRENPATNGTNSTSGKSTLSSTQLSKNPLSRSPSKGLDDDEPVPTIPVSRDSLSRAPSKLLESAMSGFLKQARELSRANSLSGEHGEKPLKRRRPLLGRTSSLSSARNIGPKRESRASSIDTLNEDGYGSAVDSVDTDSTKIQNTIKLPATLRGQSFTSVLSGGGAKFTGYVDSPAYHDEALLRDDDAPAMTQLNYEDPDAMAMREEFLRRAHGYHPSEAQEESITTRDSNAKRLSAKPTVVVDELPSLEEELGNRTTGRRTRRSANKSKEADNNIF